ncbi:MAG: hypothetical protein GXP45_06485 [bacterium]|nr:hypothetical protein [bacterium]
MEPGKNYKGNINNDNGCRISLEDAQGNISPLSNPKKAYIATTLFKIIPFATTNSYFNNSGATLCQSNYLVCPHHPGFWFLTDAYSPNFSLNWSNNIHIPIQQFFNLQ